MQNYKVAKGSWEQVIGARDEPKIEKMFNKMLQDSWESASEYIAQLESH